MSANKKLLAVIVCISILGGVLIGFSIAHLQKGINGIDEAKGINDIDEENNVFYVSWIIDGDTIELSNGERVRLIGINAPEKGQYYAVEATNKLSQLIGYNSITLEKDVSDKDQYNRSLRYVYVGNTFVNLEMVQQGYAFAYPYPPDVKYADEFEKAEQEARDAQLGMWGNHSNVSITVLYMHYDAEGNDNNNLNDEYVIFKNTGAISVNMTDWTVQDKSNHLYRFPIFNLSANSIVTLYTGSGMDTDTELYWGRAGQAIWTNTGDTLYLRDSNGGLVTYYTYPDSSN
ncbi:MAG: thermonuclease family protein [Candidatus Thermoplasmatota archaeon]|nr:thermonuclease family protein [Candidatus Thermoplasmatota archaeon]